MTKLYVKIETALMQLQNKKGQNTVEYLLMLGVIVGLAVLAGTLIKKFMPDVADGIFNKIKGGIGNL